ncbi:MAG: hypothetical protein HQK61_01130 [Desulfamplus sp.]|nr:hypothetical protein [Desulfamplus sp.]
MKEYERNSFFMFDCGMGINGEYTHAYELSSPYSSSGVYSRGFLGGLQRPSGQQGIKPELRNKMQKGCILKRVENTTD